MALYPLVQSSSPQAKREDDEKRDKRRAERLMFPLLLRASEP